MPVTILKKPKASKTALPSVLERALSEAVSTLASKLDLSNRKTRTPIGWITDGSPSMTGFTQIQLDSAESMVDELRKDASTARSVMMNVVQIGTTQSSVPTSSTCGMRRQKQPGRSKRDRS